MATQKHMEQFDARQHKNKYLVTSTLLLWLRGILIASDRFCAPTTKAEGTS